jgi:hypothetical protein
MAFRRGLQTFSGRLAREARCFSAVSRLGGIAPTAISEATPRAAISQGKLLPSYVRSFAAAAEPAPTPIAGIANGRITQV